MTRETRDLLAGQARERGVSLSAMLADVAGVRVEGADWESALADGVD